MEFSVGEMNYFETLDWFPTPPTPKNPYKQPREQVLFSKTRKKHINGFFRKLCFHLFILINNIPMQNELTLA